ncbi:hypothetical protein [Vibrio spartinae]|uniref:hypothetical protein n=1 Tax=Vibrio spartinae TaxID=1918945 RepID=UPI0015F99B04|nr:hypothetical protein [Vibrio spartinae]
MSEILGNPKKQLTENKTSSAPLENLRIGSVININAQDITFSQPVIDKNISKVIKNSRGEKSMTGQSGYVYNSLMNKGSLGFKGSYGVSGISRLNATVSAYVGNSNVTEDRCVSVNYNVSQFGGVEYISFSDLNASDLLASLSKSTRQDALDALKAYNETNEFIKENNIKSLSDIEKLSDEQREKLEAKVSDWAFEVGDFYRRQGTGIVVGVVWGGSVQFLPK